ncbi:MAG: DUF3445 domain-containing protein [Acidimicrobiales bacterium]
MSDRRELEWVDAIAPPFQDQPFVWTMGVRPLALDRWLIIDADLEADRAEKAELLAQRPQDVVATMPGSEPASSEVLALVTEDLRARQLDLPERDHDAHPIEQAARLVQEDLVVMERDLQGGNEWRMTAACVCFPTRWHLASKLGRSMAGIHVPVPRYDTDLSARTDTFFDRLRVERPVWRTNWTIDGDHGNRLEPGEQAPPAVPITADNVADALCLRVEYQTLRRLPETDAILFTIRILRRPLGWVLTHDAGPGLATALTSMPDDVAGYKAGSVRHRDAILEWLDRAGVRPDRDS